MSEQLPNPMNDLTQPKRRRISFSCLLLIFAALLMRCDFGGVSFFDVE
ncbi:MAG: hypothetical protein LBQ50_13280 [Planctomycetaceae bacterium]|nr:hypothetical protein [Planctomycetaceae bacterium]